jgi:hypothetical protein
MVFANAVGHGTHCMPPVAWVGRWKFLKVSTKVWSCERHTEDLVEARRLPENFSLVRFDRAQIPCRRTRGPGWPIAHRVLAASLDGRLPSS